MKQPSIHRKMELLHKIRIAALVVSDKFKSNVGGDEFLYQGGMNHIEALRDAINQYNTEVVYCQDEEPSEEEL